MPGDSLPPGPKTTRGPILKEYLDYLVSRGYAAKGVRESVRVVEHFMRWLGRRSLTRAAAQEFMRRHVPICRCKKQMIRELRRVRMALHRLGAMTQRPIETRRAEFPRSFVDRGQKAGHFRGRKTGRPPLSAEADVQSG